MTRLNFTLMREFMAPMFGIGGVSITGSNRLNFGRNSGLGVLGGASLNLIDPGEFVKFAFDDPAAEIVLSPFIRLDSNGNGVRGECLIEAFDSNGVSLGQKSSIVAGDFSISNLFGDRLISAFQIQPVDSFGVGILAFSNPVVSITALAPAVGEADTVPGQFRISRSGSTSALTVNLAIDPSSTLSPADYQLSGGSLTTSGSNLTVTIPAGVDFVDLNLTPVNDERAEATETLKLNLTSGAYNQGTSNSAAIALIDNDFARISLSVNRSSLNETGSASIVASSSTVAEQDIQVNLAFSGTAIRGTDFTTPGMTIVIPAGSTAGTLDLSGIDNSASEPAKTIAIDIASLSSSVFALEDGVQQASILLLDDDSPSTPGSPSNPTSSTPGSPNNPTSSTPIGAPSNPLPSTPLLPNSPIFSGRTAIAPASINFRGSRGLTLRGNSRANALTGTAKNDIIRGLGKNDRLRGLGKNDRIEGGAGNDRLDGGAGNDQLSGGDGNDTLLGGSGNDVLIGGNGADILTGGAGKDLFVFNGLSEAGDRITDFSSSDDLIDLRGIFAAASFSGSDTFARFTQFVQLAQVGSNTEVRIDADGNGAGTTFATLATLQNVNVGAIGSQNFVIA